MRHCRETHGFAATSVARTVRQYRRVPHVDTYGSGRSVDGVRYFSPALFAPWEYLVAPSRYAARHAAVAAAAIRRSRTRDGAAAYRVRPGQPWPRICRGPGG